MVFEQNIFNQYAIDNKSLVKIIWLSKQFVYLYVQFAHTVLYCSSTSLPQS